MTKPLTVLLYFIFYSFILGQILSHFIVPPKKPDIVLVRDLISGSDSRYVPLGAELKILKPLLPISGTVSFLMDHPYQFENSKGNQNYKKAQNYLAPLVLNPEPGEALAVIFCSNSTQAQERAAEGGYRWFKELALGKGLARK